MNTESHNFFLTVKDSGFEQHHIHSVSLCLVQPFFRVHPTFLLQGCCVCRLINLLQTPSHPLSRCSKSLKFSVLVYWDRSAPGWGIFATQQLTGYFVCKKTTVCLLLLQGLNNLVQLARREEVDEDARDALVAQWAAFIYTIYHLQGPRNDSGAGVNPSAAHHNTKVIISLFYFSDKHVQNILYRISCIQKTHVTIEQVTDLGDHHFTLKLIKFS